LIEFRAGRKEDDPMARLLALHGPNLNLLGTREPEIYGYDTLADIDGRLEAEARAAGHELVCRQSNAEHVLVDLIHQAKPQGVRFIIFNPGAFTHTSIALRDALLGVGIPFIEVHLSNVHSREPFRQHSYLSDVARGVITGLGARGYSYALQYAIATVAAED
jgi:3-dehydroquinate dehydratase-2